MYLNFPNYRNYWREAGYGDEMDARREGARGAASATRVHELVSERWLARRLAVRQRSRGARGRRRVARRGRDARRSWCRRRRAGNQLKAFEELFAAFAG